MSLNWAGQRALAGLVRGLGGLVPLVLLSSEERETMLFNGDSRTQPLAATLRQMIEPACHESHCAGGGWGVYVMSIHITSNTTRRCPFWLHV